MINRITQLLLALFLILSVGLVTASDKTKAPDKAEIRAAIDSGNAKWIEAHRKQDGKLLASLFCEDGAFLLRSGVVLQGRGNIEKEFGEFLKDQGPFEMTITTAEMWVIDSLAYEYGDYTRKSLKPGADTATFQGRYFEIWKQQPAGGWKVFRDCGLPK
jgi:ketosteroid isomerase-like protein